MGNWVMVILIYNLGSKMPSYDLIPGYHSEQECRNAIQQTIVSNRTKEMLMGDCFKEEFLRDFLKNNQKEDL